MKRYYPVIIASIVALVAIIIRVSYRDTSGLLPLTGDAPVVVSQETPPQKTTGTTVPTAPKGSTPSAQIVYEPASARDLIRVDSPVVNATLFASSPIKVSGQATGAWFFEASFPVVLTDVKGKVIATGQASAMGNWMTTKMVSFTGSVSYVKQTPGTRGFVILKRDNPSDLPQNDASVKIPVVFN